MYGNNLEKAEFLAECKFSYLPPKEAKHLNGTIPVKHIRLTKGAPF